MGSEKVRVGIVGLTPERSWAAMAHLPALKLLPDSYEVVGVANSSAESARNASQACGIPKAFDCVEDMAASDDIDLLAVTVKVPHHHTLVSAAVAAGKSVYCEWPLGNGLQEARELHGMASEADVVTAVGTQAVVSPAFLQVANMINAGAIGEVLSSTIVGTGLAWGASIEPYNAYLYDHRNGATMLTIPIGHTLAAVMDVLGPVASVSAQLSTRRPSVTVMGTDQVLSATSPDDVMIAAEFDTGVPLSIRYCGGTPSGTGFLWEIHGTQGSIQVTGPGGHTQLVPLTVSYANAVGGELKPVSVDSAFCEGLPSDPLAGNVARVYARLHRALKGEQSAQPDFAKAVAVHRVIDAIEVSARLGARTTVE